MCNLLEAEMFSMMLRIYFLRGFGLACLIFLVLVGLFVILEYFMGRLEDLVDEPDWEDVFDEDDDPHK